MEEKQLSDKRFALLIDADNVSAKYIKPIMDELSKYGTVTIKRIYGDWTLTLHAKWKDALLENSITPIQQFGYTQGKNATDSAMIIDAMDILYTDKVDGFCIVSSDSDFTRLAARLRESGLTVIGMGEKKTPVPFRKACDIFTTLELLLGGRKDRDSNRSSGQAAPKDAIEQAVVDIITDNQNNGKSTGLGEVGSRLLKRYPDFDVRSYGTNLLSKLLGEFERVQITKRGSNVSVELAEDKAAHESDGSNATGSANTKSASDVAATANANTETDEAAAGTKASTAEAPTDTQAAADAPTASEASAAASDVSTSSSIAEEVQPAKPSRSRRSRRRRSKEAAEAATAAAPEQGELAGKEATATQAQTPNVEASSNQNKPSTKAPRRRRARKRTEEGQQPVEKQPSEESDAATNETASAKPKASTRSRRRKATPPASEAAQEAEQKPAPAAADERLANPAPTNATTKATAAQKGKGTPETFIRQQIHEAGAGGVNLGDLGKQVRAKFRAFKLRDLGYTQFRRYVADLDDIIVEKQGGEYIARLGE